MKTMRGFTIMELMIVVAIMATLAAWGIPSFQQMAANNRQVTGANMLITSFQHARSEAITRAEPITISAIDDDWINGWSVDTAGGDNLAQHEALAPQFEITFPATSFTYSSQGRLNIAATQTIELCDDRSGEIGRRITLEPIGRVSVSQFTCDQP